jgi:HSP20 family protein
LQKSAPSCGFSRSSPHQNAIFEQISPFFIVLQKIFRQHSSFSKKLARFSLIVVREQNRANANDEPATKKEVKIMMNTQILPNAFYGIQNFIDSLNAANAQGECTYTPKADYYETEGGFALEVEIPGVKKEDLDIQVEKNILTVKATRARKDEKFTYERSFRLAEDIDTDNIKVSLENGILKFDLAKKAQAAARKLTIA